jgi:hypothetical protein
MEIQAPTLLRRFAAHLARLRKPRPTVASMEQLAAQLAEQAMFVSQKCTTEYLRLRAGVSWDSLCRDPVFRDGYEQCRWAAFVRVLGDVAEICEIVLRAEGWAAPAIDALVPPAAATALARYPAPRQDPTPVEAADDIRLSLARRRADAPRPLRRIGSGSAKRIMALLPFDESLQAADLDYMANNLAFALGQVHERLRAELNFVALAAR